MPDAVISKSLPTYALLRSMVIFSDLQPAAFRRMRITSWHALGEEVVGVVQQAVSLAGRRGHAQVTPLHIASAMLSASSTAGLIRAAFVRTQSHPLQHNALELCLDVALDRLAVAAPASAADHRGVRVDPAPSNAFAAALKRAEGHRRQGDKVELEHLVISILDDPTIDRVMRSAGFSSSQLVRAPVENAISSEQHSDMAAEQPSIQTAHRTVVAQVPDHRSDTQTNKVILGPVLPAPAFFDGNQVVTATAILPPWLRCYKETLPAGSTLCGITSLQADLSAHRRPKFMELTAQNLKILSDALQLCYPRQGDIVPAISSTVLLCRSGMARSRARKNTTSPLAATTTWLFFLGRDSGGKTAVARELARLVFGSYAQFTALRARSSDEPTPSGKLTLKRRRSPGDGSGGYVGARLFEAIAENPHRILYIDGVDLLDPDSEMRIKDAMVDGTVREGNGDVIGLEDAIVVLCSDVLDSRSVISSSQVKRRPEDGDAMGAEVRSCRRLGLDLNACPEDGEDEQDILADDDEAILNFADGVFVFK